MAKNFGGDSFDSRERIREAIDIVDLVERYVPLRRQGANWVGRCPWHDDSRPSLQVSQTRQTFKCWVCNIGGDVFSFIMKIENVDFKEAMQILADMAGIELKPFKKRARIEKAPQDVVDASAPYVADDPSNVGPQLVEIDKPTLYRSLDWLARKYRETFLNSPEAEIARRYVEERGISEESCEKFQIGYSPADYDAILQWINYDRKRARVLEATGTLAYREEYDDRGAPKPRPKPENSPQLSVSERRRLYDRFRGRVIFPIRDVQNRVVAFGGRVLPNSTITSPAKYVNSPETPVFVKSKMVYGLDRARNEIHKSGVVLITEGYTDCIMTAQFGFGNVVAALGTALGPEHIRILKRFAGKMILMLDGDEAGRKRAKEVLRYFVEQGVDMRVLTLPDDDDPCEFLLEKGPDAFRQALENNAVDALDHAFAAATEGVDLENDVVGSARALDSLLDELALFPRRTSPNDPARLRMIGAIQRYATRFRVSEDEIRRQIAEKRRRVSDYAERNRERDERYARREQSERDEAREIDPIEEYRAQWIYPVASEEDESDEQLRSLFPPFEAIVWSNPRLMPSPLEREYLEVWLADPETFPRLVANVSNDDLRSPVAKQIDQLAREELEFGRAPTFNRIILRYEDDRMKSYLEDLASGAEEKGLQESLADPERREKILRELFVGFERERIRRETPIQIGMLRDSNADPETKLQTLLELQRMRREDQRRRDDDKGRDD